MNKQQRALRLKQWMKAVEINTYEQLSDIAKISSLQLYRLENGLLDNISLKILKQIAKSLNISVVTLISELGDDDLSFSEATSVDESEIKSALQQEVISILESLIIQLPTFAYVTNKKPDLPATKLLPLLKPLNELLSKWEIKPIGEVGEIVAYNPQEQELIEKDANITELESVKIRYVGYKYQNKLLYRAKVSSILDE